MGPADAANERDTKLANKPLTGSESFQLWRWQVTMGTKSKGLYHLLEDTPQDKEQNLRNANILSEDIEYELKEREQKSADLSAAENRLEDLTILETADEAREAESLNVATLKSQLADIKNRLHALDKKAQKVSQKKDTLMFLLSKVLDTTNSIKVQSSKTPSEMWNTLVDFYQGQEMEDQFSLEERLHDMTFIEFRSCDRFLDEIQSIANRLASMDAPIADSSLVIAILKKLPEPYKPLIAAIRHGSSEQRALPSVLKAITAEAKRLETPRGRDQRLRANERRPVSAFNVDHHQKPQRHRRFSQSRRTPHCYRCGEDGHYTKICPAPVPVPEERQQNNIQRENRKGPVAFIAQQHNHIRENSTFPQISSGSTCNFHSHRRIDVEAHGTITPPVAPWIIDTGASAHMTQGDPHFEEDEKNIKRHHYKSPIIVGNGSRIPVTGIGKVHFENITLTDVLLVPNLCTNLLSVSQALTSGSIDAVVFTAHQCTFLRGSTTVATAPRVNNMWQLPSNGNINNHHALPANHRDSKHRTLEEWHSVLGHTGYSTISKMIKSGIIKCSSDLHLPIPECPACIRGKMKRPSFQTSATPTAQSIGHTTHADLVGPFHPRGFNGCNYILTLVDDFTRYITSIPIKSKSDAKFEIMSYLNDLIDRNLKPRKLRSDNGTEFTNSILRRFLQRNTIQQQTSNVFSPAQNGVAERANRTTLEGARTLMIANNLPKNHWPHAFEASSYSRNRVLSSRTGKIPAVEFGIHLQYDDMIPYCQPAHVMIPAERRNKLDSKTELMRFIGFSYGKKGLRFMTSTGKIVDSRDFTFSRVNTVPAINSGSTLIDNFPNDQIPCPLLSSYEMSETQHSLSGQQPQRECRLRKSPVRFSDQHFSYSAQALQNILDPETYDEAVTGNSSECWKSAMDAEYQSLLDNDTWTLQPLPKGRKSIGGKWVFKTKIDKDGAVARYKARYVAQGFKQIHGVDFDDTFAPTVNKCSLRTIIAIAAAKGWPLEHMDATTAFLNGVIDKDVFIHQPRGFEVAGPNGEKLFCHLKKAIYGLKQAGRTWWQAISQFLIDIGFRSCLTDTCVFELSTATGLILIAIYVDDFVITGSSQSLIDEFKKTLQAKYKVNDLGPLQLTLGICVLRSPESGAISLTQSAYTRRLLSKFNMSECHPATTPQILYNAKLGNTTDSSTVVRFPYREAVGALLYLSTCTRPDIAVAVNSVARHCNNPSEIDVIAVKRIMRYLAGTTHHGITYERTDDAPSLVAFVDSDWASDKADRRSISGFVVFLNGPVSWGAVKQSCVALSTAEAEYVALSRATQEVMWLRQILSEIRFPQLEPTIIHEDNAAAIIMANNAVTTPRSKHIDIRHHYIRECVQNQVIKIQPCSSVDMIADIMTKPLPADRFKFLRTMIFIAGPTDDPSGACWNRVLTQGRDSSSSVTAPDIVDSPDESHTATCDQITDDIE